MTQESEEYRIELEYYESELKKMAESYGKEIKADRKEGKLILTCDL